MNQLRAALKECNLDAIEKILRDGYQIVIKLIPELPTQLQDAFADVATQNEALLQQFESNGGSIEAVQNHIDSITASLGSGLQKLTDETSDGDVVSNDNSELNENITLCTN